MPTLTLGISRCIPTLASPSLSYSFHVLPTFNESCGVTSGYLYLGFVALDLFQLHFTVYFGSLPCSAFSYFIFSSCGPYLIKVNLSRKSFFSLSLSLPRRTAIYSFRPSCLDRVRFVRWWCLLSVRFPAFSSLLASEACQVDFPWAGQLGPPL